MAGQGLRPDLMPWVPEHIERFLTSQGWQKTFDSIPEEVMFGKHIAAMQKWEKDGDHASTDELYIHYREDGRHVCELYAHGDDKAEEFKLRVAKRELRKRGRIVR